mmetsp:Transcript_16529/g.56316  ORF Transcript_16529/g.56316 Transcript_16529/m.56316 type:complete len:596 (-) Transcript_16529:20-1807(-)
MASPAAAAMRRPGGVRALRVYRRLAAKQLARTLRHASTPGDEARLGRGGAGAGPSGRTRPLSVVYSMQRARESEGSEAPEEGSEAEPAVEPVLVEPDVLGADRGEEPDCDPPATEDPNDRVAVFPWLRLPKLVPNGTDSRSLWSTAFCGFCWSCSTLWVFSLLPIFLTEELGASNFRLGQMEGSALLMAAAAKAFSGVISDLVPKRSQVVLVGSLATFCTKLVFTFTASVKWVIMAKMVDRFAKGVRHAPTDALVADLSPRELRGRAYGIYQTMTTAGGVCGSVIATTVMGLTGNNYRITFALAVVPTVAAVWLLLNSVMPPQRAFAPPVTTEVEAPGPRTTRMGTPKRAMRKVSEVMGRKRLLIGVERGLVIGEGGQGAAGYKLGDEVVQGWRTGLMHGARLFRLTVAKLLEEVPSLPVTFWKTLLVAFILMFARFSEAFVTMHARALGWSVLMLPTLLIANNFVQTFATFPLGVLADRTNSRKRMLLTGFGVMLVADIILLRAASGMQVMCGFLLVGLHMAMTQGNLKAALSASLPPKLRGTGFSIVAIVEGVALAFANMAAGRLCDILGSAGAFYGGGVAATAALIAGMILL